MMQRNHQSCCFFWVNNISLLQGGWLKRSSPRAGRNWWTSWCSAEPTAMSSMARSVWEAPRTAAEALVDAYLGVTEFTVILPNSLGIWGWSYHPWLSMIIITPMIGQQHLLIHLDRTVGWCCKGHRAGLGWRIQWFIEENIGKLVENWWKTVENDGKMMENDGKVMEKEGKSPSALDSNPKASAEHWISFPLRSLSMHWGKLFWSKFLKLYHFTTIL